MKCHIFLKAFAFFMQFQLFIAVYAISDISGAFQGLSLPQFLLIYSCSKINFTNHKLAFLGAYQEPNTLWWESNFHSGFICLL